MYNLYHVDFIFIFVERMSNAGEKQQTLLLHIHVT